jgi:hypothetical protein
MSKENNKKLKTLVDKLLKESGLLQTETGFPISFECKSKARYAVYQDYWQAADNSGGHVPAVVIKQNNANPLIVMDLEHFLKFLKEATK